MESRWQGLQSHMAQCGAYPNCWPSARKVFGPVQRISDNQVIVKPDTVCGRASSLVRTYGVAVSASQSVILGRSAKELVGAVAFGEQQPPGAVQCIAGVAAQRVVAHRTIIAKLPEPRATGRRQQTQTPVVWWCGGLGIDEGIENAPSILRPGGPGSLDRR